MKNYSIQVAFLYIDGSCSVEPIKCSLVIPVNRQRQSDGCKWCWCCGGIVKMKETSFEKKFATLAARAVFCKLVFASKTANLWLLARGYEICHTNFTST